MFRADWYLTQKELLSRSAVTRIGNACSCWIVYDEFRPSRSIWLKSIWFWWPVGDQDLPVIRSKWRFPTCSGSQSRPTKRWNTAAEKSWRSANGKKTHREELYDLCKSHATRRRRVLRIDKCSYAGPFSTHDCESFRPHIDVIPISNWHLKRHDVPIWKMDMWSPRSENCSRIWRPIFSFDPLLEDSLIESSTTWSRIQNCIRRVSRMSLTRSDPQKC